MPPSRQTTAVPGLTAALWPVPAPAPAAPRAASAGCLRATSLLDTVIRRALKSMLNVQAGTVCDTVCDTDARKIARPAALFRPCARHQAAMARDKREADTVARSVNKHIRIDEELWERLEAAALDSDTTANRLLSELAAQWLENRDWPRTAVQIRVARSSLFAAQAIARDMKKAGRQQEIDEILEYAALIVPDHAPASSATKDSGADEPSVSASVDQVKP